MTKRPLLATAIVAAALALAGCQASDEDALSVVVSLPDQDLGGAAKATLAVDYSGTGARILAEGGGPACAFILPGFDGDFSDDHKGGLTIRTRSARVLRGPLDIVACRMRASDADATASTLRGKLSVNVSAAEDAAGKAIDLAARSKAHGTATLDESEVEAAQAEAVKAAASVAPAPSAAPSAAPGSPGAGGAPIMGSGPGGAAGVPGKDSAIVGAAPATGFAVPGGAAAVRPVAPPPPKPAAGALLKDPAANTPSGQNRGNPVDEGVPAGQDRDPGYDDTPADDTTAPAYTVEIAVSSQSRFGALQFEITHLGNSGGFIGRNDKIDCVPLVEAIIAGNYVGERVAKLGLISLQGILTPAPILRCGFRSREAVGPASFLIDVTDASDTNSDPLDPMPTVVVSQVFRR